VLAHRDPTVPHFAALRVVTGERDGVRAPAVGTSRRLSADLHATAERDCAERVQAGRAQPCLGPGGQVAGAGSRPRLDQVTELRVAVCVLGEMAAQATEEHLVTEMRDELAEHRCAFRVGDSVEVVQPRGRIGGAVAGHRVGGRAAVCGVAPRLACDAEPDAPRVVGHRVAHPAAEVFGEGLVEPQVVPPAHGDQIAEPHVGHLVGDRAGAIGEVGVRGARAEHEWITERDAARVLHRAGIELGYEGLVVLAPRVADPEQPVELVEAVPGDREQLRGVAIEVWGE
jgi:hypothetical protein